MKYFWLFIAYFLGDSAQAQPLTVRDVKVSVTADSAATAREQALAKAHQLAFQKLVNENFPERANSVPSQDVLRGMVSDFSIDREKTTPTSYTASLTFQFDDTLVRTWAQTLQQGPQTAVLQSNTPLSPQVRDPLIVMASYRTYGEWQYIRKTLEDFPGVRQVAVMSLSPKNANVELIYDGAKDKLIQGLMQNGLHLSQQEQGWVISSNEESLR